MTGPMTFSSASIAKSARSTRSSSTIFEKSWQAVLSKRVRRSEDRAGEFFEDVIVARS